MNRLIWNGRAWALIGLGVFLSIAEPSYAAPVADAGPDANAVTGQPVTLNGSGTDPDNGPNPLTFQWTFAPVPLGSTLTDANITDPTNAQASFTPDVIGLYRLTLTVSAGALSASDDVDINVTPTPVNVPPNAAAGPDANAVTGQPVTLNGSGSDLDNGPNPLTFQWGFAEVPAGSLLTDANITDPTNALASFTPDVIGLYRLTLTVLDGALSASDDVDINVTPALADLALSLTGTPAFLTVNGQLTYTITVENNGPGTATGVRVEDSRPPGATVLEGPASSSQGECRGTVTVVVCDLGTLAAGAEATVTINVIPLVTGDLSSAANVTAVETDPDHANNSGTETTTVEPEEPARADLAITVVAEVNPRASDQGFTYTLTVRNDGPATATGVQLTNDLPRGIALDPFTVSQANCTGTDPVLCDLVALPSGATETVTIDVIRTEVGTLPNRAAVNGDQHDPNRGNNFALTSALDLPTPRTNCNRTGCSLRLTCNLSDLLERSCDNQVTLFVDTRARRDTRARLLTDERAARPPGVRFATAAITNFPGGQTKNVRLKLTPKGKKLASTLVQQGTKKLRGVMRISNAAGGTDTIRLTVRLR